MTNENLNIATDGRYRCKICNHSIKKGEKFFRDAHQSYRASHTVNICQRCIVRFYMDFDEKEIGDIKKEIILEKL